MPWWPHRAKGVGEPAVDHRIGRRHRGTCGAQHRPFRAGAATRVRIEMQLPTVGTGARQQFEQPVDVLRRMREAKVTRLGQRCFAPLERHLEAARDQKVVDRIETLRTFRMAGAHLMQAAIDMAVKRSGHRGLGGAIFG